MAAEEKPQEHGPESGRIMAELDAIFRTPEFERAPVMRQLLGFLVRTTLAGGGDDLKAYTVAVEGLGRDPDFDSQSDSYPRVQVGRLRKMLDAYYANGAPEDGVRFHVKQGSYRVHFVQPGAPPTVMRPPVWEQGGEDVPAKPLFPEGPRRSSPPRLPKPPFPWRLVAIGTVLLLAFVALIWIVRSASDLRAPLRQVSQAPVLELGEITANGGPEARMLAAAGRTLLEDALHRAWLIRVRESDPTSSRDAPDVDAPVYRLIGRADTSGALGGRQIVLTLLDLQSGDQIWSDVIDVPVQAQPAPGQIAPSASTLTDRMRPAIIALISPFGVIASHQRSLLQPTGEPGYACMLDYESYFRYRDPNMRARVRDCVRETVAREPMDPVALAAATFISLDPTISGGANGLARSADYARRAVAANSKSAEAQIADARVAMMHGQCVRGRDLGLRGISLNPYNPELAGMVGYLLISCNDPEGPPLLQRAIAEDPDVPAFYGAALILALVEQGDTATALHVADTIRPPGAGMYGQYEVTQTFAQAARGNIPAAREHWAKASQNARQSADQVNAVLSRYFYVESLRTRMVAYLRRTGVIAGGAPISDGPAPTS
ncbi:MAG: tetratricopeptide repeat protein [Sphingobium sp.]